MAVSSNPPDREEEPRETSHLLGTAHDDQTRIEARYIRIITVVIISVLFIEIGDYIIRAPTIRLLEDLICRKYYSSRGDVSMDLSLPIPEESCKIAPIQGELAMLKGWDTTFTCIPGILLAIPYGALADKFGRKLVLMLSLFGTLLGLVWLIFVLSFGEVLNLKWIWFGNAFLVIGGGPALVKSMYYAIISDVAPEEKRVKVFFQITAVSVTATVIGVPSAWYLMEGNLFIPMWIGSACIASTIPMVSLIPETLKRNKIPDAIMDCEDPVYTSAEELSSPQDVSIKARFLKFCSDTKEASFILKSPILLALSVTFLFQSLGGSLVEYQYLLASERFHWKLKDASFLMPIGSVANFVILIFALPYLYHLLANRNVSSMTKDLVVMRGSLIFMIIGSLVIAWGPLPGIFCTGVIITAGGIGLWSALRSLATSLVHPDQVSRLYAIMAVGDTLGAMLYSPLVSKGYGWGMKLGGHWTGMVFLISALVFVLISIPAWFVRKPTEDMDVHG